jgi:hypothetical protein
MNTWIFTQYLENESDIPVENVWKRLRLRRNELLSMSDFRVLPDAPWDTAPWAAYRQALRDLPEQTSDPRAALWPEPPTD